MIDKCGVRVGRRWRRHLRTSATAGASGTRRRTGIRVEEVRDTISRSAGKGGSVKILMVTAKVPAVKASERELPRAKTVAVLFKPTGVLLIAMTSVVTLMMTTSAGAVRNWTTTISHIHTRRHTHTHTHTRNHTRTHTGERKQTNGGEVSEKKVAIRMI